MKEMFQTKWLTFIGFLLTFSWFGLLLSLPATTLKNINYLSLNELGDLLAGTVAPVAIFWFIVGYFQQGKELKQNTEALKIQAAELKNQVEETKALVEQTSYQAKIMEDERNLVFESKRPRFVCERSYFRLESTGAEGGIVIHNKGEIAIHFWASCEVASKCDFGPKLFEKNVTGEGYINIKFKINPTFPVKIKFGYQTILGETFEFEGRFSEDEEKMKSFFSVSPTKIIPPENPSHQIKGSSGSLSGYYF